MFPGMSTPPDAGTTPPPRGTAPGRFGLALLVICGAQLMIVLDATIVNVALPSMRDDLGISEVNLPWVLNAYTLAFGGLLMLGARAGDILGRRRMFVIGVLVFALASLVGGFATSPAFLYAARVVQGVGGAIAAPAALSLVTTTFPEGQQRNRAFGIYAAMSGSGAAIGLILGGILTDLLSWRFVLFVNAPIGLLVALLAPRVLTEAPRRTGTFDLPGAVGVTAGVTVGVYGLTRTTTHGWSDPLTLLCLIGGVALLGLFLLREAMCREPLVPLWLFRNRDRGGANLIILAVAAAMFGVFYFLTLFVQGVLDYSPLQTGFAFLPVSIAIMVAAGVSGQVFGRFGAKPLLVIGPLLAAGALLWLSTLSADSSYPTLLLPTTVLFGFGVGISFVPLTAVAVAGVDAADAGLPSGLLNTTQQVGGAIGLAVLATVASTVANNHAADAASAAGATRLSPAELIEASVAGYADALLVGAGMCLAAMLAGLFMITSAAGRLESAGAAEGASQPVPGHV